MNIIQWIEYQLANATVTAALLGSVAFLLRATISERIRAAIGHEYDMRLEELRASNTTVLEELRSARAEREAFRAMAVSLMTTTRTGTLDRRINAVDVLWRSLHNLRSHLPYMVGVLDQVGWDPRRLGDKGLDALDKSNYLEALAPSLKSTAEVAENRPFLGDQLYSLYHAAQAILGQAVSTTILSYQQRRFRLWFEESDTVDLLRTVLSSSEFDEFNNLRNGKLDWLYRKLEAKIVLEIQRELSGEPAAEQALFQAARILERTAAIENPMDK